MAAIAAAHNIPYVATACPGYPFDLMNKARKAAFTKGPAYLHVMAPCPTGWRMDTRFGVKASKLAVQTGIFPLYEVENGQYFLSKKGKNRKPIEEYLKIQGRFKHLKKEDIETIQESVDKRYAELEWLASRLEN